MSCSTGIVWRIENKSSDEILPQWPHLKVGDIVPDGPDYAAYFRLAQIAHHQAIVYRSVRHPYRGHPVDPTDPAEIERVEQHLIDRGVYLDFSWAFALRPIDLGSTRLIIRTRANIEPRWTRFAQIPLGLVDLYHVSTMLRAITKRVGRVQCKEDERRCHLAMSSLMSARRRLLARR